MIIAMDQSGSMATSLIYGGIMGAILASMPAVETHVVAFNHEEVVDLTEHCHDPVDLLFGVQLGGAEDYWKATSYCERFMHTPAKTLYILLGRPLRHQPQREAIRQEDGVSAGERRQGGRPAGHLRPGAAVVQRQPGRETGEAGDALFRLHARPPSRPAGRRSQGQRFAAIRREGAVEPGERRFENRKY